MTTLPLRAPRTHGFLRMAISENSDLDPHTSVRSCGGESAISNPKILE